MDERSAADRMIVSSWPEAGQVDKNMLNGFEKAEKTVLEVRRIRNEKQINPKEKLRLLAKGDHNPRFDAVVEKLANLASLEQASEAPDSAAGFVVKGVEYFIPLEGKVDLREEKEKLEKELAYTKGFLASVEKKLSNERFVSGAPEQVVAAEKSKKADAESKIKALQEQLQGITAKAE